jgi:hypothetical protein
MALTKTEQRERIKKLESRALRLFKNGGDGKDVNRMLEQVIKWEDLYYKRYGINPSKQYGDMYE